MNSAMGRCIHGRNIRVQGIDNIENNVKTIPRFTTIVNESVGGLLEDEIEHTSLHREVIS